MSFDQACVLAQNFSVDEMVRALGFPAPSNLQRVGYMRYPTRYIAEITGHDISSPLDSEGYVSQESLATLNTETIRGIAEHIGIKHFGKKKKELVKLILERHPKAKPAPIPDSSEKQ
jgi:hypothetical protein